jgi:hypothetical protein
MNRERQYKLDVKECAILFVKLMKILGYKRYCCHGGDWGSLVSSYIGILDPDHCRSIHITLPLFDFEPAGIYERIKLNIEYILKDLIMDKNEILSLNKMEEFDEKQSYYYKTHMYDHNSISYSLSDSPIGLASYIISKFFKWTHFGSLIIGDSVDKVLKLEEFERKITKEDLLTNILIYLSSNSIHSSLLFYKATHLR